MNTISLVDGNINNDDLIVELQAIKQNTSETTINAGDIELHVDGLEALIALTNDKLDHLSSDVDTLNSNVNPALNNIDSELEGQTVLLTTGNSNTAHISDNLDHISSDLDHISADLDASLVKQTAIDVGIGGTRALLTNILTKNTEIDTALDTIDSVLDNSLVKQTNIETLITTLDGVQDNIFAQIYSQEQNIINFKDANHTDIVNTKDMVSSVGTTTNNNLSHISDNLDHLSANSDTIEASLTSMEAKMDVDNAVYDNQLTKMTEIDTALDTIDSVLDNSLVKQTNIETLITSTNSKIDTFDAVLDTIAANTADLENVNAKITACNTGAVVISSGAVTASLSPTDNAVLDVIAANTADLENVNAKITACNTGAVVLAAGSAAIGKLSANSGVDIGDVDVTSISAGTNRIGMVGLKANEAVDGSGTERHVLCDSAGHLQVDVKTTNLDLAISATATNTAACATDLAAIEVLQTAANVDLAAMEVLLTAANVDHAANEALLTTIDADTNDIKTNTAAAATDLAAIEVLQTAANVDLAAMEVLLTAANVDHAANEVLLTTIATKSTLGTTSEIKELLSNATVNQGTLSAELDTEHYEKIRLFGETSASVGSDIKIFGSNTSGGTFYYLNNGDLMATSLSVSGLGTAHYIGGSFENIPRYIKIFNNSGSTNHTFTKLYMVGSGGRVAV